MISKQRKYGGPDPTRWDALLVSLLFLTLWAGLYLALSFRL